MKMREQGLAMIHTPYEKVVNRKESVDVFAQFDTKIL